MKVKKYLENRKKNSETMGVMQMGIVIPPSITITTHSYVLDTVTKVLEAHLGVLGELISGLALQPATLILQSLAAAIKQTSKDHRAILTSLFITVVIVVLP